MGLGLRSFNLGAPEEARYAGKSIDSEVARLDCNYRIYGLRFGFRVTAKA